MCYTIRHVFQCEIDNSFERFYAPFNLNTLKIILHFNPIELNLKKIEKN
jgi:hypothetical protein